jgi:hypothetical protein
MVMSVARDLIVKRASDGKFVHEKMEKGAGRWKEGKGVGKEERSQATRSWKRVEVLSRSDPIRTVIKIAIVR